MQTSTVMGEALQVRVLDSWEGLDPVAAAEWDELTWSSGPVGTTSWERSWLEAYGLRQRTRLYTVWSGRTLRAALPLVQRPGVGWEMLGVRQLHEPTDVIGSDPAAVGRLAVEVSRQRLPLRLRRLPADSLLVPALRQASGRRALVATVPAAGTPTVTLDGSWQVPESHFNAGRRSDFRAARRRAEKLGAVAFEVLSPEPAEVDALLDEVIAVEGAGWKREAGTALAVQPGQLAFFRAFCRHASRQGVLRLAFLRIDGRPVAVQLAVEQGDRFSLLKIGYDQEFRRVSPGNLLMLETVRWAAERGVRDYDLLGQEEPWTAMWSTGVRPCVDLRVDPLTPAGLLAGAQDGVSWGVRAGRWAARRVGAGVASRA